MRLEQQSLGAYHPDRWAPSPALGAQIDALISPTNLAITAGSIVVWAGSHFFGVGEVVDVGLLLVGAFFVGWSMKDVVANLVTFGVKTIGARTEQDLDEAARAFAAAVIVGGITAVMAILLRRSAKGIQATRGANILDAARPRNPGLKSVPPDRQAGVTWRKPTITGDPTLPPGIGETNAFGDVRYSTAGSATDQQLARLHELVHSFFRQGSAGSAPSVPASRCPATRVRPSCGTSRRPWPKVSPRYGSMGSPGS